MAEEEKQSNAESADLPAEASAEAGASDEGGKKILIVEDYAVLARMYQNKLRASGFEVEVALDGAEGEKQIHEFKPDLVLLDVMLPKKDGLEILKGVKEDPDTAHIPVIMLTNLGGPPETVEQALQLGAVAYLVKAKNPPRKVIELIRATLAREAKKPVITKAPEEKPKEKEAAEGEPRRGREEKVEKKEEEKVEKKEAEKPRREKRALREAAEEEVRKATTLLELAQKQAQESMGKLKELEEELEEE
jgi:two-component system response regulator VicR